MGIKQNVKPLQGPERAFAGVSFWLKWTINVHWMRTEGGLLFPRNLL